MSCCAQCDNGLGALRALYGLGAVLAAGSRVRVGFALDFWSIFREQAVIDTLGGCLGNTGQFTYVDVTLTPGYAHYYLHVNAETAKDFSNTEDFGALVAQKIQECVPQVSISRRDAVAVDYVPSTASAGAQQPRDAHGQTICAPGLVWQQGWFGGGSCVQPSGSSAPQKEEKCGAEWKKGMTAGLACELGVTPNEALMVAGLGAALALIIVMKIVR